MAERKVQQFDPVEDDFFERGEPHTLDLTDGELRMLAEAEGEPVLLERLPEARNVDDPELRYDGVEREAAPDL